MRLAKHGLLCAMGAIALVACSDQQGPINQPSADAGKTGSAESTESTTNDWKRFEEWSPVHGAKITAHQGKPVAGHPSVTQEIEIICVSSTRDLSTVFSLYSDDPKGVFVRELRRSGIAAVRGWYRTAEMDAPSDDLPAYVGSFKNEAILSGRVLQMSDFPDRSEADLMIASLPIALELEADIGKVTFVIPRNPVVVEVVSGCLQESHGEEPQGALSVRDKPVPLPEEDVESRSNPDPKEDGTVQANLEQIREERARLQKQTSDAEARLNEISQRQDALLRTHPDEGQSSTESRPGYPLWIQRYVSEVMTAIGNNWVRPEVMDGTVCTVLVIQRPGGVVESAEVVPEKCDFDPEGQQSILRAIEETQPLPYAGFERAFNRRLNLTFRATD